MNILLVDDNRHILKLVEEHLKKFDVTVVPYNSSFEALAFFTDNSDRFDLVITDIMMPEINGIDFCSKLKSINSSIPILAITAGGNGRGDIVKGVIHHEAVLNGAEEVLQKPFEGDELEDAINRVLSAA